MNEEQRKAFSRYVNMLKGYISPTLQERAILAADAELTRLRAAIAARDTFLGGRSDALHSDRDDGADMSHTITHTETWDEEICDNCGHSESVHYKKPVRVKVKDGEEYIAYGCMVIANGTRKLEGTNNSLRYPCTEFN